MESLTGNRLLYPSYLHLAPKLVPRTTPGCISKRNVSNIGFYPSWYPAFFFNTKTEKKLHLRYIIYVFSSHPFWTSSSLDVPAGVTQEEGHTGFLIHLPSAVRALIFVARRIQPFLSLVDREVEFCVLTN